MKQYKMPDLFWVRHLLFTHTTKEANTTCKMIAQLLKNGAFTSLYCFFYTRHGTSLPLCAKHLEIALYKY